MKYQYYITDTMDGAVRGTNDHQTAKIYAESEDYFVVDATTGEWLHADGTRMPVEPSMILPPEDA